jgi:cellulose biosynthesis protein BcsQ
VTRTNRGAEGISGRVKFLPLAWAGMPKTSFRKNSDSPPDFSFRNLDLVLDERKNPTQRLKKLLSPLAEEYDLIILDCPPNISLLSESIFAASDILLSPIIPTTLSLRTLEQLKKYIKDNKLKHLQLVPFFLWQIDARKCTGKLLTH